MERIKSIKSEVLDHKCPSCASRLNYNPTTSKWNCKYCDNEYTLEYLEKLKNASNIEKNKTLDDTKVDTYDDYISYYCPDCGAEIITDEQTVATFCIHCGNTAILRNKLSGKFKPDKIIPFKKTKEDAINAFKSLAHNKSLVPNEFVSEKNIEKIKGVYVPFWFHDFKVEGELNFIGETQEEWKANREYVTQTNIYEVTRDGKVEFENIPLDGSSRFSNDLMDTIQPYDYKELETYNHAYLSGFYAERYDEETDERAKLLEEELIDEARYTFITSSKKYTNVNVKKDTLKVKKHESKYVLLPIYTVNVKYNGIKYIFIMNGQTGEFIGKIPIDRKKTIVFSSILLVTIYSIIQLLLYLLPLQINNTILIPIFISGIITSAIMQVEISGTNKISSKIETRKYLKYRGAIFKTNKDKLLESHIKVNGSDGFQSFN